MSDTTIQQLRIYCGMSPKQAQTFLDLCDGKTIEYHQFLAFGGAGLVKTNKDVPRNRLAHTLTNVGGLIRMRILSIQNSTYHEVPPRFTPEELTAIREQGPRLARTRLVKSFGVQSAHLKALTAVSRHPGIVMCSLVDVFNPDTVGLLISKNMIGRKDEHIEITAKHVPLYPLTQGLSFLNLCLNQIKLEGE